MPCSSCDVAVHFTMLAVLRLLVLAAADYSPPYSGEGRVLRIAIVPRFTLLSRNTVLPGTLSEALLKGPAEPSWQRDFASIFEFDPATDRGQRLCTRGGLNWGISDCQRYRQPLQRLWQAEYSAMEISRKF
uniref:Secreted protein n=1 Tax=Panagrellus redivivus TaxID=6233 RepID=A0A7E4VF55_PANRE